MEPIKFTKAHYLKLGAGGKYERASIGHNKARIGWDDLTVKEINGKRWETLKRKLRSKIEYKSKGAATRDINALRTFVESKSDVIWITFYSSHLWWGRLGDPTLYEDEISRYRLLDGDWHDCDIHDNPLLITEIPGSISKVQRFQGTICNIKDKDDVEDLKRLINDQPSQAFQTISETRRNLVREVREGIRKLHWKDFEILVDLLFRNAGWNRISVVGETMKYSDLELEERITGEHYQVQVKAHATIRDFEGYAKNFVRENFRKLYFVVHSPDEKLAAYHSDLYHDVELILPERLAQMVVDLGLTGWLLKKIK